MGSAESCNCNDLEGRRVKTPIRWKKTSAYAAPKRGTTNLRVLKSGSRLIHTARLFGEQVAGHGVRPGARTTADFAVLALTAFPFEVLAVA